MEDLELVTRSRSGDVEAFTALVKRYEVRVYNLAYRLLSNADDAADVAQEAFMAAYESIGRFRAESSFYTWLYRIAVNKALTYRRSRSSRLDAATGGQETLAFDTAADGSPGPSRRVEDMERDEMVQSMIAALPDDFRSVVVLKDIEGLEYEEIADVMEIPLGTVKSRLHRGRLLLRDALTPYLRGAPRGKST